MAGKMEEEGWLTDKGKSRKEKEENEEECCQVDKRCWTLASFQSRIDRKSIIIVVIIPLTI